MQIQTILNANSNHSNRMWTLQMQIEIIQTEIRTIRLQIWMQIQTTQMRTIRLQIWNIRMEIQMQIWTIWTRFGAFKYKFKALKCKFEPFERDSKHSNANSNLWNGTLNQSNGNWNHSNAIRTTRMEPWHDSEHPEDQVYACGKWDIGQGLAANCHRRRRDRKCNGIFLLGLTDSGEWKDRCGSEKHIANASKAFGALRQAVFKDAHLSTNTKRKVYQACVLSVLIYGGECWTPLRKHLEMNTFHHKCIHTCSAQDHKQKAMGRAHFLTEGETEIEWNVFKSFREYYRERHQWLWKPIWRVGAKIYSSLPDKSKYAIHSGNV